MNSKRPRPGDILHYRYLWREEQERGLTEGSKPRPALVIGTFFKSQQDYEVYLLPVTHSMPIATGGRNI